MSVVNSIAARQTVRKSPYVCKIYFKEDDNVIWRVQFSLYAKKAPLALAGALFYTVSKH
jgi:hypothetical protein